MNIKLSKPQFINVESERAPSGGYEGLQQGWKYLLLFFFISGSINLFKNTWNVQLPNTKTYIIIIYFVIFSKNSYIFILVCLFIY